MAKTEAHWAEEIGKKLICHTDLWVGDRFVERMHSEGLCNCPVVADQFKNIEINFKFAEPGELVTMCPIPDLNLSTKRPTNNRGTRRAEARRLRKQNTKEQ